MVFYPVISTSMLLLTILGINSNTLYENRIEQTYISELDDVARLSVNIEGADQPLRLVWSRVDGKAFPKKYLIQGNDLIIFNMNYDSAGVYRCSLFDSNGYIVAHVDSKIVISDLPHITFSPTQPKPVKIGESRDVYCNVTGNSIAEIRWHPISPSVKVDGPYLRFLSMNYSDAGRYYCTATNPFGNSTKEVQVIINNGDTHVGVPEGHLVRLDCNMKEYSEFTYLWVKENGTIPESALENDYTLWISEVSIYDEGLYICKVSSPDRGLIAQNSVSLKVKQIKELNSANATDIYPFGCLVPAGEIILTDRLTNIRFEPESYVRVGTRIKYSCPKSYIFEGWGTINYCANRVPVNWTYEHPECIKLCPPILDHTIESSCEYKEEAANCKSNVKSGTTARVNCAVMYAKPRNKLLHNTIYCQKNGTWNHQLIKCEQICSFAGSTTLFNSDNNLRKPVDVPWHINIYSKTNTERYQYICGGVLIQSKIVISAAHCFWDDEKSVFFDKSKFIVTAGKFNRGYYSQKEPFEVQRISISKIHIPTNFDVSKNNFGSDIAILTLKGHIKFSNYIVPICLSWSANAVTFDTSGLVVGFGSFDSGATFPLLRSVNMKVVVKEECSKNEFIGNYSIPNDKFCATSENKNERICKEDSGGAFVYYHRARYWLAGIFSNIILPNNFNFSDCHEDLIRTFTNIYPHKEFIKNVIDTLAHNDDYDNYDESFTDEKENVGQNISAGCLVPENDIILTNIETKVQLKNGTTILSSVSVNYSCPEKYTLDGEINNSCNGRIWKKPHPTCIRTCSLIQGYTIRVDYYYNGTIVKSPKFIKPGTTARIKCAMMYKKPSKHLIYNDVYCDTNGEWDFEPFQCEQICGTLDTNLPFSVNSTLTQPSKVPWHVGIYSKNQDNKFEQICGGTIIQSKIVISAAHCFWDLFESAVQDKSNFIITTGKFYRDFYADNEILQVQKINISKIDIPITFYGANYDWTSDIAILTLSDHIVYKSHVRPACLTWREQNDQYNKNNKLGTVAGWGITDSGTFSPELRSVELTSIDSHTCKSEKITKNDNIASDKFCVETGAGKNVCPGDSGGGFVVPIQTNKKVNYNLWGIVSNGIMPWDDIIPKCNSKFITTFTDVQYYKELITDAVSKAYL